MSGRYSKSKMTSENLRHQQLDLSGQVAIVTGAGRGIGRAIALALAGCGADVAIGARTRAELDAVAAEITGLGRRCAPMGMDVTRPRECSQFIEHAVATLGPPDILVNNAGSARFKAVHEYGDDELDLHYQVNYRSTHVCSREVLKHMIPRRKGTIINIASSSGKKPYVHQGPYCAMKAAVIALSKVMALELRDHGIRVHVICPGAVDTAMADLVHPERDRTGWMKPEDVAQVVLDLLALPAHLTVDEVVMRRFLADPL